MQSSEEAYLWSHTGVLSGQGPILPGEGEQVKPAQTCPLERNLPPAPGSSAWPIGREGLAPPVT